MENMETNASMPTAHHRSWALVLARLSLGWIFLWAFLDKLFGLGYSTTSAKAWINGGSPTTGYLTGASGWLGDTFNALAGSAVVDWLFMLGLLGIGLALILGIGLRIAAVSGTVLMLLMWLSALPLKTNPFMDDHLIYALLLWAVVMCHRAQHVSLAAWWGRLGFVQKMPWLK